MADKSFNEPVEETSLAWRLLGLALIIGSAALVGWLLAQGTSYLVSLIGR